MKESKLEQYYPTYKFDEDSRDVLLIEFEEAQKIANSQTKMYGQVANILIGILTILIPLFFSADISSENKLLSVFHTYSFLFACVLVFFGGILLRYFVDLQKQITINARKVVTLRSLLGVDYGSINLTIPNWRVEGATNPFCIKYFKGWFKFESTPFWVLLIGINFIWYLATKELYISYSVFKLHIPWYLGSIIILCLYYYLFRVNLNDLHETFYLNLVCSVASLLGVNVKEDYEYIIYRAKLSSIELERLKIKFDNFKKTLIEIEDKDFYSNKGIAIKSMARAFFSQIPYIRKKNRWSESGGSTLTMQLARTLFIENLQSKYRRKLIEILLAPWINKQFKKDEILKMYISSVRFEKGVYGLMEAKRYFFKNRWTPKIVSDEEAFFLVERLSNITSSFKITRINSLKERISCKLDEVKLLNIYRFVEKDGLIKEVK